MEDDLWPTFVCSFTGPDGARYGFAIQARDFAHAEELIGALKVSAELEGELVDTLYDSAAGTQRIN